MFERARDPRDPLELVELFIGRTEHELGRLAIRPEWAERWRNTRRLRRVDTESVLASRTTSRFVKELFNFFFRDDLYGVLRRAENIILSSGTADESVHGLPAWAHECITFALDKGWYGYSDSRGRDATRAAIAALESVRIPGGKYTDQSISVTMGGTFGMNAIADFLLHDRPTAASLCHIPNYPPLVEAVARRAPVRLVPGASGNGRTGLRGLIDALSADTPLVMLQTVTNPTGCRVDEVELEELIASAAPTTTIVLDEAHECAGPEFRRTPLRAAPHVVRLASLSKSLAAPGLKLGWIASSSEFVSAFYEYASTSYGGPPSLFYLLLEVYARFERWHLEGVTEPGSSELSEFESAYSLNLDAVRRGFSDFVQARGARSNAVIASRNRLADGLTRAGFEVVSPQYSLNLAAQTHDGSDPYVYFRRLLASTGVSVYPGQLNCMFDERVVRLTAARSPESQAAAIDRLSTVFNLPEATT